ncbi:hypothetical protein [Legionella maioricensis]|uniref:Uncharacterized protein n=1 Tax=Legionella maioricensis TaxID=2896528 RepID=A0A9X2D004_9GAMM|nr:hypothetical protein [Legionella maioricensis]MCL9683979.1 hypothetical protein [Legionella maioricensis]MCL9687976.1 hypothetical protein [Legionella maioricensis]
MLTKKSIDNGAAQEKADEENQLTAPHTSTLFFKRKKSGYHPSARNPVRTAVQGRDENNPEPTSSGEEPNEPEPFYSPKAGFNRAQYESRDTGRAPNDSHEISYKSFLISTMWKRETEEALADREHDSALDKRASLDYSI